MLLGDAFTSPDPSSIDSVLDPSPPDLSDTRPTLFRERHGWCPYSERVWLALELLNIEYDTVRIDNSEGPRPSYFSGQTPQIQWPISKFSDAISSRTQGESRDLVTKLDEMYNDSRWSTSDDHVIFVIDQFSKIFPARARPSSRAAFSVPAQRRAPMEIRV
jgi:glutathione S-transferase